MRVAIVHDYLTQRGGAERVVLSLHRTFPDAPIYASMYEPSATFDEFRSTEVRPLWLNRVAPLRLRHRLALPLLAPTFASARVEADVLICSSSGWAHGVRTSGTKIVFCHTPARWLYQSSRYIGQGARPAARIALGLLGPSLRRWDHRSALSADRYLANSSIVQRRIAETYGVTAEVLHPPHSLDTEGVRTPVRDLEPGFALCVSRLLPYKNVDAILAGFAELPDERLVVAGTGPEEGALRSAAPANVRFVGNATDDELRWLYANGWCLVAASYEDFGLTPVEAAAFGTPSAVLGYGGFLDTVVDGRTGVFFDAPEPKQIAAAVRRLRSLSPRTSDLLAHGEGFSERRFAERLRRIVAEAAADSAPTAGAS